MKHTRENEITDERDSLPEMLNDCSIDRVMAIDSDWNIISWNRTSETISGISRSEVLGRNLLSTFPEIMNDEEMLEAIKNAFEGHKSFLPSNSVTFNRVFYENHFIPLKDHHDNVIGVMNIMHDVSHRIKAEKQLQKLNRELEKKYDQLEKANRELATFTQITSQDIKEPLRHVYTSLELLVKKEGQLLSNISKGNLRRMQGSLNKMNLLLDDILTVSGLNNNDEQIQRVDLNGILQRSLERLSNKIQEKNAKIESDNLPSIPGYPTMLQIIFHNLIDNAIKFQEDDSLPVINITAQKFQGHELQIPTLSSDHNYIRVGFTDNGIGFNPEDQEQIFKMFHRLHDRRFHGSGIGLTLCKKIVEAHEGHIEAVSVPGEGSTFYCYFPAEHD
jgi:PAS domain S-box-containing protein